MVDSIVEKGIKACQASDFKKGVELFTEALKENPLHTKALYNRARALSKIERLEDALKDFEQLVKIEPSDATFIGDYAVALHLNNKDEEALVQFYRALELEPKNPYRWSSLGFFKDRIGKSQEALSDYEKAIALDPEDAIALNNKGLIEEKLGYQERSKKSFDQSNKLVGYNPSEKSANKTRNAPPTFKPQPSQEKATRWGIIKSVFTKEGFKDFSQFTKNKMLGSKE